MAEVELNIEKIIEEIKKTRFFSEYLPPAFLPKGRLDPFNMDLSEKPDLIEPLKFNMSRFSEDGKRRSVYIPEFASYVSAAKFMIENDLVEDLIIISSDSHSFSPLVREDGSLIRHENEYTFAFGMGIDLDSTDRREAMSTYIPNVVEKINRAKGAKGILYLDIANYYQSIYTHLFPSIKLGYEEAERQFKAQKANNTDPSITDDYRKYARLDEYIRNMNAARTNGIMPGLIVSQFIAEGLLARIDEEIESSGLRFVRYVDDYEFFIYDEQDLQKVQNVVSSVLEKYFLTINNEKTKYTPFPYYMIENLQRIVSKYSVPNADTSDLIKVFNTFFELEKTGTKGAIRFLIKSINDSFVVPDDNLLASYLFDVLANDSRSLVKVCQLMIKRKDRMHFGDVELSLIENVLAQNIERDNHLEVVWLLYLWKRVAPERLPSEDLLHQVAFGHNELAKLVLIEDYEPAGTLKDEIIHSARSWLLLYQLFFHDLIDKNAFSEKSKIKNNVPFYARLKRSDFSFYNSNPEDADAETAHGQ